MAAGHSPSSAGCPQRDVHDDYSWSIAMTDRSASRPVLAILGGTGDLGTGLARRWAQAGYTVVIGSRTADRAETAAQELAAWLSERGQAGDRVRGTDNLSAAQAGDIVTLTVPFGHQTSTLEQVRDALTGKILVDVTVPLVPPRVARVQMPEQGSAGQIAQQLLGDEVQVVSAFQNVAAHHLQEGSGREWAWLACGNSREARQRWWSWFRPAACGVSTPAPSTMPPLPRP